MALFKILRGGKDTLASQELHDGWAYFTPEDGGFYIDVVDTINNKPYNERIKISGGGGASTLIECVLEADSWTDNSQTISSSLIETDKNYICAQFEINDDTFAVMSAAVKANIELTTIDAANQSLIFTCNGNVPIVDIPVKIILSEI